ncbi:hypothetical protein NKG94_45680 [Micromonospora sp. M12]
MTDAWRAIFQQVPQPAATPVGPVPAAVGLTRESPLEVTELTARARSALERLGLHTVGELLDAEPSALTRAKGVPDATRKEILAQARALRAVLPGGSESPAVDEQPLAQGVEALCATLLPASTSRNHRTLAVLLGQTPTGDGEFLCWPAQSEAARPPAGASRRSPAARCPGQELAGRAGTGGGAQRDRGAARRPRRGDVRRGVGPGADRRPGLVHPAPKRLPQAIGLVRAAVEAELSTGGDARVAIHRFRTSGTVLVGREPDDPASGVTAADFLGYVVELGGRAAELAGADPLPTRQRAVEELRRLSVPAGCRPWPTCGCCSSRRPPATIGSTSTRRDSSTRWGCRRSGRCGCRWAA